MPHPSPDRLDGPLEPLEFDDARNERLARRRLFRQLVKDRLEDGPLSRLRRWELLRFARGLELESFEARLILRAVEYECRDAAGSCIDEPARRELLGRLADPEEHRGGRLLGALFIALLVAAAVLIRRMQM